MAREDEKVDAMEIDGQKQQDAPAAVPDGFNADYLRIYYGKVIPSLLLRWFDKKKSWNGKRISM